MCVPVENAASCLLDAAERICSLILLCVYISTCGARLIVRHFPCKSTNARTWLVRRFVNVEQLAAWLAMFSFVRKYIHAHKKHFHQTTSRCYYLCQPPSLPRCLPCQFDEREDEKKTHTKRMRATCKILKTSAANARLSHVMGFYMMPLCCAYNYILDVPLVRRHRVFEA